MKGILGRKIGMTQIFSKNGQLVPVTVIEVEPNVVTQIKTIDKDGYDAVQLGFESIREKVSNKAKNGHTNKVKTTPKRFLREIRGVDVSAYTPGQEVKADLFEAGEIVDVTGISKGKGYQGVIKKDNQHRGPMAHGSKYHRGVGSLGTMLPKRVLKGKALPGHMGVDQVTIQNLEIIKVDLEDNCILVKGSVPGAKKSLLVIKNAVKTNEKKSPFELISYNEEVEELPVEENEVPVTEALEETVVTTEEVAQEPQEETEEPKEESTTSTETSQEEVTE